MTAEPRPGMDHDFYDWSPITSRPPLTWPNDARVALCVIVSLDHYQWRLPPDSYKSPEIPGGISGSGMAFPDITAYSFREYGQRVGLFRVMEILDKYAIPATVAMNAVIADNYPYIIQQCKQRRWEIIAYGIAVNQMITSLMTEETERDYVRRSIESITRAAGSKPRGWLGPEYGESTRTLNILAEEGIQYVCDWANDDQPYRLKARTGELFALPNNLELDDAVSQWFRRLPIDVYSQMIMDAFDTLYEEGAHSGRLMVINIHPWIIGRPFRSKYLDMALAHICDREGVWKATGSEIIDWYRSRSRT